MARHFIIKYKDGSEREENNVACSEEPSFYTDVRAVTETDGYGNERTTYSDNLAGIKTTINDTGFFHENNDNAELTLLGTTVIGSVLLTAILAGYVVYLSGKLVYHIATIEKRRKEAERDRLRRIDYEKSWFAEKVKTILTLNNRKLDKYKELFELGVLTEQEYKTWVQKYIDISNQEIDKEKAYLEQQLRMLKK